MVNGDRSMLSQPSIAIKKWQQRGLSKMQSWSSDRSTNQFTGLTGKIVELEDNSEGCDRILNDEFADTPEKFPYTIGSIDEAVKAENSPP